MRAFCSEQPLCCEHAERGGSVGLGERGGQAGLAGNAQLHRAVPFGSVSRAGLFKGASVDCRVP